MKSKLWKCLLLFGLLVLVLAIPVTVSAEDANYTVTISGTQDYDEVNVILEHVNQYRKDVGASPVTLDVELTKLAMQRAAETAVYWSHTRPNDSRCFSIMNGTVFSYGASGENIAYGYGTGAAVSNGWYNSPGHYSNMVNTSFTTIGIGHFRQDDGTDYWVQLFSSKSSGTVSTRTGTKEFTTDVVVAPICAELSIDEESFLLYPGVAETIHPRAGNAYLTKDSFSLSSGNSGIIKADGNKLIGVSAGTTNVTLAVTGRKITVPLTVKKHVELKYTVEDGAALVTWDNPDGNLTLYYRYEGEDEWWYGTSGDYCYVYLNEGDVIYLKLRAYVRYGKYVDASKELKITSASLKGIEITTQPKTAYAKMGEKVSTTVKAEGDGLKYQWYIKNADGTKYSKSSITSATYSCKMNETSKGRRVYCVITDAYGNKVQTKTVLLRMAASITTQPKSVVVAKGEPVKISFKAAGDGLKYTWYYKNAGADEYSRTDTFTGNTYTISSMDASRHGRRVLCKVTDKYGKTVKTNSVTISMEATITQQPKTSYAKLGQANKITVKAVGDGLKYEWYYKNPGATKFSKTTTFTGNTYTISSMDAERSGRQVYCKITDKYGNTVKTKTVTLRLAASVKTQPKSVVVAKGETAKVSFKAVGDGLKYEWYYKDAGSTSFKKTTSFTGNSYTIASMTASRSGRQLYCKVTDKYGNTVKTTTVTIKMK